MTKPGAYQSTRPLKVYGWQGWRTACPPAPNGGKVTREIVATRSKAQAARLAGYARPDQMFNLCETGNAAEIAAAMARPEVVLWRPYDDDGQGWRRVRG